MYNSIMVKICSGTTIRKKTYMGDRKLVKAIIDLSCETIEDWAFANCHCLKEIRLPLTIREVSEKAFLNCDALEQVYLYDPADSASTVTDEAAASLEIAPVPTKDAVVPLSSLSEAADPVLLATTLKCYPKETNALIQHAKNEFSFLQYTDARLENFLTEDDNLGFVPFLAGGEEDYPGEDAAAAFRQKRQFLKVQLIYERILSETHGYAMADGIKQTCIKWLQNHNPSAAFAFLLTETIRRDTYLDLYFTLELNKDVNIDELTALAEGQPELKAKLLRKHLENSPSKKTLFSNLEI